MAVYTNEYLTLDIFMCRPVFQPNGICHALSYQDADIEVTDEEITETVKVYVNGVLKSSEKFQMGGYVSVKAYSVPEGGEQTVITAFIQREGTSHACLAAYPPCSKDDIYETVKWERTDSSITARLPLPNACSIEEFRAEYSDGRVVSTDPGGLGTADGKTVQLTFSTDGRLLHETLLDGKYLVPGETVNIYYKLTGTDYYIHMAAYEFQTNIFTSAEITGSGLAEKTEVYKDPARPLLGKEEIYLPIEGGEGYEPDDNWIYDTRFRYMAKRNGKTVWLKTADFAKYSPGDRVSVTKSAAYMPLSPHRDVSYRDVKEDLSEEHDMITQELFFN